MAYPFMHFPRFSDVRERLEKEFGCTYDSTTCELNGETTTFRYFMRKVGDEIYLCEASYDADTAMTPTVLRSLCARLKLSPKEFGMHLG